MERHSSQAAPARAGLEHRDDFHLLLNRTIMMLGQDAVDTLRTKTVAIAGCGGQGGAAAILLARLGVGGFILADPKPFDEPDINRQWGATHETLGRNKALVYADMLRAIQQDIRIRTMTEGITEDNAGQFLDGADLLIDCLDICVAASLRAKVFARARAMGIYASTGGMIGFGGFVTSASPDGIPMEFILGFEDQALGSADLPPGLRGMFVPEHVDELTRHLDIFRAPSLAVSPALLASALATEALVILLGATIAGWRPPVCIPRVLLADTLRMTYRVVSVEELFQPAAAEAEPADDGPTGQDAKSPASPAPSVQVRPRTTAEDRRSMLARVGNNTNLLPDEAVDVDLLTDSWSEIHFDDGDWCTGPAAPIVAPAADTLRALWGYRYILPVFRGRFAESMLAAALAGPRGLVVTNSLFPTTRAHMQSVGFDTVELTCDAAFDPCDESPFKGDLDLSALAASLAGGKVRGVYLELSNNALGGHPVSIENLREVRRLTSTCGAWVILDATRAFENAALIQQRCERHRSKSLVVIVRELCSHSDFCACSCSKDIKTPVGGFIGSRHADAFYRLRDLTLARGDGLRKADHEVLQAALAHHEQWVRCCEDRVEQVRRLWHRLSDAGVPVVRPVGGHAVYVDACAALPHIPAEQSPAQALANELFVRAGVRVSENLAGPQQIKRGQQWLRLAVPIARYSDNTLETMAAGLIETLSDKNHIAGLERHRILPGVVGEFACSFRPSTKASA